MGIDPGWLEKFAAAGMHPSGEAPKKVPLGRHTTHERDRSIIAPGKRPYVELPPPPSTNNLFVNTKTGRRKADGYKDWIAVCTYDLWGLSIPPPPWTVRLTIVAGIGWNERRDLDNAIKPVQDLLVSSGLLADDSCQYVRRVICEFDPELRNEKQTARVRIQVLAWNAGQ